MLTMTSNRGKNLEAFVESRSFHSKKEFRWADVDDFAHFHNRPETRANEASLDQADSCTVAFCFEPYLLLGYLSSEP